MSTCNKSLVLIYGENFLSDMLIFFYMMHWKVTSVFLYDSAFNIYQEYNEK